MANTTIPCLAVALDYTADTQLNPAQNQPGELPGNTVHIARLISQLQAPPGGNPPMLSTARTDLITVRLLPLMSAMI